MTYPRPAVVVSLVLSLFTSPTRAQPIDLGTPIDVGATLRVIPFPAPDQARELDQLRDDYAVAGGATGVLVAWVEDDHVLYAAILDAQGAIAHPRFELHNGPMVMRSVQSAFVDGKYVVAASDLVQGLVVTRVITVSDAGAVLDSFEYGGIGNGGIECSPGSLAAASAQALAVSCGDRHLALLDIPRQTGELLFWFPATTNNLMPELDCRQGTCVVVGPHSPSGVLDKNVALIRFGTTGQLGDALMLGYRDATNASLRVVRTGAGALVVSRSFMSPPGHEYGQQRERLHGFFVDGVGTATAVDPVVDEATARDPRLATNGTSIALAHRANGGATRLVALEPDGTPRGAEAELSAEPTMDVRLGATPAGAYVVAYDMGSKLWLRRAWLDPGVPAADGGASLDASVPVPDGGSSANGSNGCACNLGPDHSWAPGLGLVLLVAAAAAAPARRRRRRP